MNEPISRPTIDELEKMLAEGQHVNITPSGECNRLSEVEWFKERHLVQLETIECLQNELAKLRARVKALADSL